MSFPHIQAKRKTGEESFRIGSDLLGLRLLDFWRWAASDLVSNTMRGVLAEYIVASALGAAEGIRREWDAFDIKTNEGLRVEVKSCAYIQSWAHKGLSKISFGIRQTRAWNAETNVLDTDLRRQADVYVFCVLATQDQEKLDPLDVDQWQFYVLPAGILDEACPTQKTIGLSSLLRLNPAKADYYALEQAVAASGKSNHV